MKTESKKTITQTEEIKNDKKKITIITIENIDYTLDKGEIDFLILQHLRDQYKIYSISVDNIRYDLRQTNPDDAEFDHVTVTIHKEEKEEQ